MPTGYEEYEKLNWHDYKNPNPNGVEEESEVLEFKGEYLGGHVKFPDKCYIVLQLGDNILDVTYPHLKYDFRAREEPFISIPYEDISSIQSLPREKIDTLRVLAVGLVGVLWRKKEFYLTLTFKDDLDMNQSIVFKMEKPEKAQRAIYDKVAEAKKKKRKVAKR